MTSYSLITPKDHAQYYAKEFELSVIVLNNPDTGTIEQLKLRKHPAGEWQLFQIMRASQKLMDTWFAKNPNYNIAIVMGSVFKTIGFDIDGPTAAERFARQRLEMSTNLRIAVDNTMMTKTGSGGYHYIFRIEDFIGEIGKKLLWSDGKPHSEIIMQGNGHYLVAAPSRHPNGQCYEWDGKAPQLISRQQLNELIRLLRPNQEQEVEEQGQAQIEKQQLPLEPVAEERSLTIDKMTELLRWVKQAYTPGNRDHIIFYLSGMLRKSGYSHQSARAFISMLCEQSDYPDENLEKSLTVVDRTYRQPLNELNGKAGLHDLFVTAYQCADQVEYLARSEAFSRICQILNPEQSLLSPAPSDGGEQGAPDQPGGEEDESQEQNAQALIRKKAKKDENTKVISYLVTEVMSRIPLKTFFDSGEILYYDSTEGYNIYRLGGEPKVDSEIEKIVQEIGGAYTIRQHMKNEVKKCIMDNTAVYRGEFDSDPNIINLQNCLLDIMTLKEIPHSPKHLMLSRFPIKYDPFGHCPAIERFLGEVISDLHDLRDVLKFWAYALIKDCRFEKGMMCLGDGSNGKGILIRLFETAVGGDENCSHASLHDLEDDRFARNQLFGMTLNTYADNKSAKLKETGNIKTVISGDSIEAQQKFKPRYKFKNRAKLIISTNNPPETEDKTYAWYRRWKLPTFDRTFVATDDPNDPNRRDTELLQKLTTPEELSGWLNLGLAYLPVLLRENGFEEEPIEKVKHNYEFKADHVARYLEECCIVDYNRKDYFTKTLDLYNHYLKWYSEREGLTPLDSNVFGSKLVEHGILHRRKRVIGEGVPYVYLGVILRHIQYYQEQARVVTTPTLDNTTNASEETSITNKKMLLECPYCALGNEAGNAPLFVSDSLREVQLHILFRHPGLDYEVEESER